MIGETNYLAEKMTSSEKLKIELAGVAKSFGGVPALEDITLSVKTGGSLTLIGPSGSGKSLTLKSILGLVRPDKGSIRVDGKETMNIAGAARDKLMQRFGVLFQQSGLFDGIKVWENVGFRLLQDKAANRSEIKEQAIAKLASVGLPANVADLFPAELSGGMQKRVGIARAIATEPEILFLDEPTAGLDPIMSNIINDLIIKNVEEIGSTVIAVSSNMITARRISDHIAMLHQGRVVWDGTVEDIPHSDNIYIDQFWNKKKDGPIKMPVQK